MNPTSKSIPGKVFARPKRVILLHWFNVLCWLLLTASGLGVIRGEAIRILPGGWSEFMQNMLGGGATLVLTHSVLGLIWSGVIVLFVLFNWNSIVLPFLQRVLSLTPGKILADLWFMTVTIARLLGLMKDTRLPPAGRYNGAQRLLSTMILACSIAIVISGTAMFFSSELGVSTALFRWALVLHALCVGLVCIGLVAHIYFALVEEPESMDGMKSGYLDAVFVEHHHPEWYAELKKQGKV